MKNLSVGDKVLVNVIYKCLSEDDEYFNNKIFIITNISELIKNRFKFGVRLNDNDIEYFTAEELTKLSEDDEIIYDILE